LDLVESVSFSNADKKKFHSQITIYTEVKKNDVLKGMLLLFILLKRKEEWSKERNPRWEA